MTTYNFSALADKQHLTFDPDVDVLRFDATGITAGAVNLTHEDVNLGFSYGGKTVWLDTTAIAQMSATNVSFANGSFLLVGDGTANTLADWYGQDYTALATSTVGHQTWGLGGAGIVKTGGGDDWIVGNVALDPLTHVSRVGTTGSPTSAAYPTISADGRFVAFSGGWTAFGSSSNSSNDVLVNDLLTGTVTNEHEDSAGTNGGSGSGEPVISADGAVLAFMSASAGLIPGPDGGSLYDIFASEVGGPAIERVSTGTGGTLALDGRSLNPDLSGDGRYVVFESDTSNWAAGGSTATSDIFVKDRDTGVLTRVSTSLTGVDGNGDSRYARISADGNFVVFESDASDLNAGDTNGRTDVFVWDRSNGSLTNLSSLDPDTTTNPNNSSYRPDVAYDNGYGGVIVFETSKGLVTQDTNNQTDIYAVSFDGTFQLVSSTADGTGVQLSSGNASVSGDGRFVVFTSGSEQLVAGDTNGYSDVFVKDLYTGRIALVSNAADGTAANQASSHPTISLGGEWIVFDSGATSLAGATDGNAGLPDVFRVSNPLLVDTLIGQGGNDTYVLSRADTVVEDANCGTDTIRSFIDYTLGANLENLTLDQDGTATIGVGNELQNALVGNALNNTLSGFDGNDTLTGGGGNDTLDGGAGVDTAVYGGAPADYTIARSGGTVTLVGPDGTDTLVSVERLEIGDFKLAIDVDGHGGQAYRLYQAAFNRTPDPAGLGYQMTALDNGLSLSQVAAHFIASPEFGVTYGSLNDTQFVTQLYSNVLHRAPDSGGLSFHVNNLTAGVGRADVLVGFSESPENQTAVIGVISSGMTYL